MYENPEKNLCYWLFPFPSLVLPQFSTVRALFSLRNVYPSCHTFQTQFVIHMLFHRNSWTIPEVMGYSWEILLHFIFISFVYLFILSFIYSISIFIHFVRDTDALRMFCCGSCMCLIPTAAPSSHSLLYMASIPSCPLDTLWIAQTMVGNMPEPSLTDYSRY